MKTYTPKKPVGDSALWYWRRWIWDLLAGGLFPIAGDGNIVVEWIGGVYRIRVKPSQAGGQSGWDWMYPTHKELDPTLPYTVGKWVYISKLNPIAVVGMTDIISNATVISCQGLWECVQNVNPASGGKFNVPVFPYPAGAVTAGGPTFLQGTTAPSGSPLKGDLDLVNATTGNPNLFWIYRGDI